MNTKELTDLVRNTAGEVVAEALKTMHERRADLGVSEKAAQLAGNEVDRAYEAEQRGLMLGYIAIALQGAKGSKDIAIDNVKKAGSMIPDNQKDFVTKALESGVADAGGVFFAPEQSQQVIDLLAPMTVVRRRVKATIDISAGQVDMPRVTADAAVSWGGEVEEIRDSQPSTDQIIMRAHQEKALVPFSNTFLRRGGPRVAQIVRNSTLRALAIGEDSVFLTSPGSAHRPKGLQYWTPSANRLASTTFTGTDAQKLAEVTGDLGRLLLAMENGNVPMTGGAWAMSPRTKIYLFTARDGNGNQVFAPEMSKGTLWGFPFDSSTQIPSTLGTGADESLIFLYDGDELMLGQGAQIQVDMTDQGTIVQSDGSVFSLYQRNASALRVINEVDLVPQHREAIAHLTGVKWAQ
jgi:HK97 family phage major capsid protein